MAYPLLATKTFMPPLRPDRVLRPRLKNKMDSGLLPGRKITLISAPAGFGKTTLAIEWALDTGMPVAWLALDEGDNDPIRFWNYVVAALQSVAPEVGKSMLEALQSPQPPPLTSLVVLLINDITSHVQPFLLVLDDYHLVEASEVHDSLNFLLDHLPPNAHLALLTRSDPPLHLARRRGRGEICELRASDLRFSNEEIVQFLTQTMGLHLSPQDISALENRTEGWVAGLQMAAISLQGRSNSHELVSAFTGDDRYIADYLVEEVLQRQPAYVRIFLLKTSLLDRICAPLCDVLFEKDELSGHTAEQLLGDLDRSNLFIVPLDNRREWFRYHHLFAQLLCQKLAQELGLEGVRALYRRAAQWHRNSNDPIQSVEYALASQDYSFAAELVLSCIQAMFLRAELTTLVRWSEQLPDEVLKTHTSLCLGLAWAANATGHSQQQERLVKIVERWAGTTVDQFLDLTADEVAQLPYERRSALLEASVHRMRIAMDQGDTRAILGRYSRLNEYLPEDEMVAESAFNSPMNLRPVLTFMTAVANEMEGDLEKAVSQYQETVRVARQVSNPFLIAVALGHSGQSLIRLGRLHDAEDTFQTALKTMAETSGATIAFYGISYGGLGQIEYERNCLEEAQSNCAESIRLGKLWSSWEALLPGYLGMAQVQFALGNTEEAFRLLDELTEAVKRLMPILETISQAWRALFWTRLNRFDLVEKWALASGYDLNGELRPQAPEHTLALAHLLLAKDLSGRAAALLEQEMAVMEQHGLRTEWLRMAVLRSIALADCEGMDAALDLLETALRQAASERYVRSILDEGDAVVPLLKQLSGRSNLAGEYAASLLAQFPAQVAVQASPGAGLIEPLSARELEVLRLLADGATNAEIAERAYITVNTVKKHITSIYGKLGVSTRVQALEKARELHLLP